MIEVYHINFIGVTYYIIVKICIIEYHTIIIL